MLLIGFHSFSVPHGRCFLGSPPRGLAGAQTHASGLFLGKPNSEKTLYIYMFILRISLALQNEAKPICSAE